MPPPFPAGMPAGTGLLAYALDLRPRQQPGSAGALIRHGLGQAQVGAAVAFLHQ